MTLFGRRVAAVGARAEHERERVVVREREAHALVLGRLLVLVEAAAWSGFRGPGAALRFLHEPAATWPRDSVGAGPNQSDSSDHNSVKIL